jgi:hypothetical protein
MLQVKNRQPLWITLPRLNKKGQEVSRNASIVSISNFCAYNEATVLHHLDFPRTKIIKLVAAIRRKDKDAFRLQFVASW